ncbi:Zeta-crystallin [Dactylellina cionopaga]|nr:Zeta-crystallin [Dactylellina cionopaga]
MKGVKVEQIGGDYQVVDDLPDLSLGPDQILVKSIYVAINPVDELMRTSGLLITSWPWTPGCDVAGTIVEAGSEVTKFKVGDQVCGCPGVGFRGSGGAAEYFVFTAEFAFKKPDNISLIEAATLGVGSQTAAYSLWSGLNIALPDPQNLPAVSDEWVLILGGGGSVGGYAVQAAIANGAHETIDYKAPVEEQIAKIKSVTKGGLHRILDATSYNINVVKSILESIKDEPGTNYFASVNDWEDFGPLPGDAKFFPVAYGPVARPESKELNAAMLKYTPIIQAFADSGKLRPNDYNLIEGTGFDRFIEGIKVQSAGSAKKVVVKVQDE